MSEEKNFEYIAENPVFVVPQDVEILGIRNLVPIEIHYKADGVEKKVVAGVDYNAKEISIPSLSKALVDKISEKFFDYAYESIALPSDLFAEDRPTAPAAPKEEDIEW